MDKRALCLTLMAVAVTPAFAQDSAVPNYGSLGLSVGLYFPSDSRIRDAFGDSIFGWGIGASGVERPRNGQFKVGFSAVTANKNGNRLFLLPVTAAVEYRLMRDDPYSDRDNDTIPYVKLFGGPSYYDYALTDNTGDRIAAKRLGFTGGAELGISFAKRWNAFVRYNYFTKADDLDFSGFSVGISYLIYKI